MEKMWNEMKEKRFDKKIKKTGKTGAPLHTRK